MKGGIAPEISFCAEQSIEYPGGKNRLDICLPGCRSVEILPFYGCWTDLLRRVPSRLLRGVYIRYCKNQSHQNTDAGGDDRCSFYFTFRAENVPDELKPLCFEEYDPGYVKPKKPMPKPQGKSGFNMLWLKLYYYFVEVCCERFGEKEGHKIVAAGLTRVAREHALYYQAKAQSIGRIADAAYVTANIALSFNISEEPMWTEKYGQHNAPELLEKYFFEELFSFLKSKTGGAKNEC